MLLHEGQVLPHPEKNFQTPILIPIAAGTNTFWVAFPFVRYWAGEKEEQGGGEREKKGSWVMKKKEGIKGHTACRSSPSREQEV
jgi:hypothetical protein